MVEQVSIPAFYQSLRQEKPRLIVLHDPGQPLSPSGIPEPVSAKGVAEFCSLPEAERNPPGKGGYHAVKDAATDVACAADGAEVNGAKGANADGLHLCLADYDLGTIDRAAAWCAERCVRFGIRPALLTEADALTGSGIASHHTIELAINAEGPHTDPRQFPWAQFLNALHRHLAAPPSNPAPGPGAVLEDEMLIYCDKQTKSSLRPCCAELHGPQKQLIFHNGARLAGVKQTPFGGVTVVAIPSVAPISGWFEHRDRGGFTVLGSDGHAFVYRWA